MPYKYKRHLFTTAKINYKTKWMQMYREKRRQALERSVIEVQAGNSDELSPPTVDSPVETDLLAITNRDVTEIPPCGSVTVVENHSGQYERGTAEYCTSAHSPINVIEPPDCPTSIVPEAVNYITAASIHTESKETYIPPPTLCSHSECTPDDVLIMTLSLVCRHKLTWTTMVDILKMINAIYGEKKINTSKISFLKKLFKGGKEKALIYHYFCDTCCVYLERSNSSQPEVTCNICNKVVNPANNAQYFVSLSLESQLRQLLEDGENAEKIMKHRFTRTKQKKDNIEDVYDGIEYQKLSSHGNILSYPQNFSYSFFIDGVAVGKRQKSLWPIYVSINELPPKERRANILLVGLYYSKHDPDQQFFLKPFVSEANKLSSQGFTWDYKGTSMQSKVIPLIAVADSVARCKLLNFQTFVAYYGCTFCYQKPTRTVKKLKFTLPTERAEERTNESYQTDLQHAYEKRFEVQQKNRHHRGVKGPSSLAELRWFNLISGCVVDYMHNILLGVCKTYFELVLESPRRKFWKLLAKDDEERYSIEDVKAEIDSRLTNIEPPTIINRSPRTIKDCGTWKANEWRSWLLFYSVPCLQGLLKKKHLRHFVMLSEASTLLLQNSISRENVNEAHRLLMMFTFRYQEYFGEEYMYYNIHLLSHICKGVIQWGPISTHNAFMYEGYNRTLLQMCKNPCRVVKEISKKYWIFKAIPKLLDTFASNEHSLFFCEDVLDHKLLKFKSADKYILLGAGHHCDLPAEQSGFFQCNGLNPFQCLFYNRMFFKGMRLTTKQYAVGKKNNDSYVCTQSDFYQILAICCPEKDRVELLVSKMEGSEQPIFKSEHVTVQHIYEMKFGDMKIIRPEVIIGECIVADTGTGIFLSKMPYGCYGD